jgi:hypothetical protein
MLSDAARPSPTTSSRSNPFAAEHGIFSAYFQSHGLHRIGMDSVMRV